MDTNASTDANAPLYDDEKQLKTYVRMCVMNRQFVDPVVVQTIAESYFLDACERRDDGRIVRARDVQRMADRAYHLARELMGVSPGRVRPRPEDGSDGDQVQIEKTLCYLTLCKHGKPDPADVLINLTLQFARIRVIARYLAE